MQPSCQHQIPGEYVSIPFEPTKEIRDFLTRISKSCGYSVEVVGCVLFALGMERSPLVQKIKADMAREEKRKKKKPAKKKGKRRVRLTP